MPDHRRARLPMGQFRILLVEDDGDLRAIMRRYLAGRGYHVDQETGNCGAGAPRSWTRPRMISSFWIRSSRMVVAGRLPAMLANARVLSSRSLSVPATGLLA